MLDNSVEADVDSVIEMEVELGFEINNEIVADVLDKLIIGSVIELKLEVSKTVRERVRVFVLILLVDSVEVSDTVTELKLDSIAELELEFGSGLVTVFVTELNSNDLEVAVELDASLERVGIVSVFERVRVRVRVWDLLSDSIELELTLGTDLNSVTELEVELDRVEADEGSRVRLSVIVPLVPVDSDKLGLKLVDLDSITELDSEEADLDSTTELVLDRVPEVVGWRVRVRVRVSLVDSV